MDYHKFYETFQMKAKICELLFPRSYLVDSVEERPPYNGKKGNKTIAADSITQRIMLISANSLTYNFEFDKNP